MAYARYESVAVNTAGDVIPNATIEVREDRAGRPVVPLWANRDGTEPLGNPIKADELGKFGFYAKGGSYYIRVFTGPSQQPFQQYVRRHQAIGTAAERDVEDLATALETGTATFPTLAELEAFVPTAQGVGGKVTTGPDAGFYHRNWETNEWVFDRPLFDTLARMVVTGGTANAIEAATETGVAGSAVVMLWIEAPATNTGPVTINGKPVLTIDGAALLAGQWLEGRTYWFTNEGDHYKLRTESDVSGLVAQAEIAATAALGAAGVAVGAAGAAATSANEAAGYAAGLNIAPILPGDAGKLLQVNPEEDGSDWIDPPSTEPPDGSVTEEKLDSEAVTEPKLANTLKGKLVGVAANRAALATMSGSTYQAVDLMETGRKGLFEWQSGNLSALVTADPGQGVYVAPATAPTGVSGAWVRAERRNLHQFQFGAVGGGVTDDTLALQRWMAFCQATDSYPRGVKGTHKVSDTVVIDQNADLGLMQINADASAMSAASRNDVILCGTKTPNSRRYRYTIRLPRVINTTHVIGNGWAGHTAVAAVHIGNLNFCELHDGGVNGFGMGYFIAGYTAGAAYNTLYLKEVVNCRAGLRGQPGDDNGWSNQNQVIGGFIGMGGELEGTTRLVWLLKNSTNIHSAPNNWTFVGVAFEGDRPYRDAEIQGRSNLFYNCRWETPTPRIQWTSDGAQNPFETQYNYIIGGWNLDLITFSEVLTNGGGVRACGRTHGANWDLGFDAWVSFGASPRPRTDNNIDLGTAALRWALVRAGTGTINTSDAREKDWRGNFTEEELAVSKRLPSLIGIYQWKAAIAEKGDGARLHAGVTAQEVVDLFTQCGLNPFDYGVACFDEWEDDKAGGIEAGSRYGIRYDELWAFVASGFEARLSALESANT